MGCYGAARLELVITPGALQMLWVVLTGWLERDERRNHQGIENALIEGAPATNAAGRIRRRPRLGGVLNDYDRAA